MQYIIHNLNFLKNILTYNVYRSEEKFKKS